MQELVPQPFEIKKLSDEERGSFADEKPKIASNKKAFSPVAGLAPISKKDKKEISDLSNEINDIFDGKEGFDKKQKEEVLAMLRSNGMDDPATQKAMMQWVDSLDTWVAQQEDRDKARILTEIERSDLYVAVGDIEGARENLRIADWHANNLNLQDVRERILDKVAEINNMEPEALAPVGEKSEIKQGNDPAQERVRQKEEYIALGLELSKNKEGFPFSGILPESYSRIKSEEEEYPGFATPIDELLERFRNEGMKVVMSDDPTSGNIFILPKNSMDVENDNLFPRHLEISSDMNDKMKTLIRLQTILFGGKQS